MARSTDQRGEAVRGGKLPDVLGAGPLDLRTPGPTDDEAALDVTGLVRRLLVGRGPTGKTWAQQLAEGWIVDGLEGDPKAIVDIIDRTEKRRAAEASAPMSLPPIDDETACKILELISGPGEVATGT